MLSLFLGFLDTDLGTDLSSRNNPNDHSAEANDRKEEALSFQSDGGDGYPSFTAQPETLQLTALRLSPSNLINWVIRSVPSGFYDTQGIKYVKEKLGAINVTGSLSHLPLEAEPRGCLGSECPKLMALPLQAVSPLAASLQDNVHACVLRRFHCV